MNGNERGRSSTRRALLGGMLALAGCATAPRPPLRELYRATAASPTQPPLIVIPGAFGSRLRDRSSGREVWPGSATKLLFARYDELELPIDANAVDAQSDALVADRLFAHVAGKNFYGNLLRTLERAGGYRRRSAGERPESGERSYYVLPYDWRKDNVDSVRHLHALIEQVRADWGDPRLVFDVLAHSNGGLMARYFARYGTAALPEQGSPSTAAPGAAALRRLLLVGTPNLGTVQAVLSHMRGEEMGLRNIEPDVVATWPAVPQIMPHASVSWLLDVRGYPLRRSVYDIETWRELGWSIFDPVTRERTVARHGGGAAGRRHLETLEGFFARCLARGRAFSEALLAPNVADVPPFVFGADCTPTLARVVVEYVDGRAVGREHPPDIVNTVAGVDYQSRMFQPGDHVVTRESLLGQCAAAPSADCGVTTSLAIAHSVFLCEEHQLLTGNPSFQNNLLYTLLHA